MEYILVRTPEEGEPFLEQLKKAPVLAVDTETTGLDVHRDRLRLIQIGAPGMPVLLIDCFSFLGGGTEDRRDRTAGPEKGACAVPLDNTRAEPYTGAGNAVFRHGREL